MKEILFTVIFLFAFNSAYSQIEIRAVHHETGIYDEVEKSLHEDWEMDIDQLRKLVKERAGDDYFVLDEQKKQVKAVFKLEDGGWGETVFTYENWSYDVEDSAYYLGSKTSGMMMIDLEDFMVLQILNGDYYKYFITDIGLTE